MDNHVTAYLTPIETIVPDLEQTYRLIGNDVEYEDVERMVACIDEEALQKALMSVEPLTDVIGHQEPEQCRYGQG